MNVYIVISSYTKHKMITYTPLVLTQLLKILKSWNSQKKQVLKAQIWILQSLPSGVSVPLDPSFPSKYSFVA